MGMTPRASNKTTTSRLAPRVQRGQPTGGQFAEKGNPESDMELSAYPDVDPSDSSWHPHPHSWHPHRNPDGSPGGHVDDTATVAPTATVGPKARVLDKAKVLGNAQVLGFATVGHDAVVSGNAVVSDRAWVIDDSAVTGYARVNGSSVVAEDARVEGDAYVTGTAHIGGSAQLTEDAFVGSGRVLSGRVDGTHYPEEPTAVIASAGPTDVPTAWLDENIDRPYGGLEHESVPASFGEFGTSEPPWNPERPT